MKLLFLAVVLVHVHSSQARQCVCGATWSGGTVNVRDQPSTSGAILGVISVGQCYDVSGSSGVWRNIDFGGQNGWVHGNYVSGPQACGGGGSGQCTANLCSAFGSNSKRLCDGYGCGNYGASRGSRAHTGWDVRCSAGSAVYAPFSGTLVRKAHPYGNGKCCDTGMLLTGSGVFAGHSVMMFYSEPTASLIGRPITAGQQIATHVGLHCGGNSCYGGGMTDHIHYHVDYQGSRIDPASWLFDC